MKTVVSSGGNGTADSRRQLLVNSLANATRIFTPLKEKFAHREEQFLKGPGETTDSCVKISNSRREFLKWGVAGALGITIAFSPFGKGLISLVKPSLATETAYAQEVDNVKVPDTVPNVLSDEVIANLKETMTNFYMDETDGWGRNLKAISCDEWNGFVPVYYDNVYGTYLISPRDSTIEIDGGKLWDLRVIITTQKGVGGSVSTWRNASGNYSEIIIENEQTKKNMANPQKGIGIPNPASAVVLERGNNFNAFAYAKDEEGFWKAELDLTVRSKTTVWSKLSDSEAKKYFPQYFAGSSSGVSASGLASKPK